ncbi:unconventional myosin-XVB isoform X2 [Narcine bancroftii]|uniref:unconventional myosin-XVB isoform X2 n=1 Tax=Narcine bancroftii TaxID=1343680 RepID=UPI003831C9A6
MEVLSWSSLTTYIGNILVSLNPYKPVGIYSKDTIKQYKGREPSDNPPHIFAMADAVYTLSQRWEREQCIIITGQSGSGKTEAAKLITRYLMALYQEAREERICQAAQAFPILEAFGNAKTVLNKNSSRFGKLLWIHILHGRVVGTSISHYLLEKSRLVFQARSERNYHVFYELLAGLDEDQKQELRLQESETYFYLNQGGACEISSKNEREDFAHLLDSLGRIGLLEAQLKTVWSILSSILQLGNVCFTSYEDGFQELAVIVCHTETRIVAILLQVSLDTLNSVITHRMTETSYDRIFSPLSVESSIDARDSIAKALYSLLFDWLVQQINECLMPAEMDSSVGVVDIYGFEDLEVNSFEQLCINYANEQLQQFFTHAVLTQEQEEYSREQISWAFIPVSSRQNCLNLITEKPYGILRILDDQTSLPQATDHTFLQKCHYQHSNNPWYVKPKLPLPVFTIRHYAGAVTYQVHKFLDKNRDQLRPEVMELFVHSRNQMVSDLFKRAQESLQQQKRMRGTGRGHRNHSPTTAAKFQNSLLELLARLGRCNPFFIRCIKPNSKKIPGQFDVECVGAQLRHSGIMETIQIRKEGYPVRILLPDFISRYSILLGREKRPLSDSEVCSSILKKITRGTSESYQLGVTKVFLKKQVFVQLENHWAMTQNCAALTIQKNMRGLINRKNFQLLKHKVVVIQSHIRGHQARARYKRLKRTLVQFGAAVVISHTAAHRRQNQLIKTPWIQRIHSRSKRRGGAVRMNIGLLEIPVELAVLLQQAEASTPPFENQVTEISPPQVRAIINHSLPADVDDYPFSKFINDHFQVPQLHVLDEPLQHPLTPLAGAERQVALELFKLVLRFQQEEFLQSRKEIILGNYIVQKGLSNPRLLDEIYCQLVNQTWNNRDMQKWKQACLLMATCLSCLRPSPELEKHLLKYVSDHIMEEYRALCQHKALSAMQCIRNRTFPPTQLEWAANHRRGQMVLAIHVSHEETFATEVESWTTGEELGKWILKFRGQEDEQRGWTVSMYTGKEWRDMPGCDFVMDLIAEVEALNSFPAHSSTSAIHSQNNSQSYSFSEDEYVSLFDVCEEIIPPAPNVQAPILPPTTLSYNSSDTDQPVCACSSARLQDSNGVETYMDKLLNPVFSLGRGEMERSESLGSRMKGGGRIGPTQTGMYMSTGAAMVPSYSVGVPVMPQMASVPAYQTPVMGAAMPAMQPVHAMPQMPIMPQIPAMQTVPMMQPVEPSIPVMMVPQTTVPQMQLMSHYPRHQISEPTNQYNSSQLSSQQEHFINQQALLLAQQMTNQAISISQKQQRERQVASPQERQPVSKVTRALTSPVTKTKSTPPDSPRQPEKPWLKKASVTNKHPCTETEKPPGDTDVQTPNMDPFEEVNIEQFESFHQKRAFFQRIGEKKSPKLKPTHKIVLPKSEKKQEEEKSSSSNVKEQPETPPPPGPSPPESLSKDSQHKDEEEENKITESKMPDTTDQSRKLPEPSHKIRQIIQKYQSRPPVVPPVYKPNRVPAKPFLKKNDPKDEALSLLRMTGSANSPEVDKKEASAAKDPPKPLPKPLYRSQSSIHEQLEKLLAPKVIPPPPPPPPLPYATFLPTPTHPPESQKREAAVSLQDEYIKTQFYRRKASVFFSYINNPWKLYLRKELFYPREKFNNEYILNLLCEQILQDTYSDSCNRISKEERHKMRNLLAELQVGTSVRMLQDRLKKRIVVAARDNWAVYFSRLFSVSGDVGSNMEFLSVSHRGIKLLKSVKAIGKNLEHYKVLQSYSYVEILSVESRREAVLELVLKDEQLVLHAVKAKQAKALIDQFMDELRKDSCFVMAVKSYITDDKSLLNLHKGDIIKLIPMDGLKPGWQFGSINGRSGLFPEDHVQPTAASDYYNVNVGRNEAEKRSISSSRRSSIKKNLVSGNTEVGDGSTSISSYPPSLSTSASRISCMPEQGQYIMAEFAMQYFREPVSSPDWKAINVEGKKPNHLVKHTKVPIQESLTYIIDIELNDLAVQNFKTLMRFMGDQPLQRKHSASDYLYKILMLCKEKTKLQDEVCCQIIKQITDNPMKESCTRGWQILYFFLGYYPCTINLGPYVTSYLQDISKNPNHSFQEVATSCQNNMERTVEFGGRHYLPSKLEMEAIINGRTSRRISVQLPGKLEHVSRIRPFSVGNELLMEICGTLGITDAEEAKEFSLLADKDNGQVAKPIRWNEYIFDFLLDDNSVRFQFQRTIWNEPLRFHNDLYVDLHYNQVVPIYRKGHLLLPTDIHEAERRMAQLAAYQHRASTAEPEPSEQKLKTYLPKATMNVNAILKETLQELNTMHNLTPVEAKRFFLSKCLHDEETKKLLNVHKNI